MNELQRLIEDIQSVLAADSDAEPARIQSLETDYAAAVAGVNERLRECEQLLRSGHQAEAIQRCEVEPNLLDEVAQLDFPEAAQWGDYVVQFAIAPPPRLRVELAGEINEAYAVIEPLKDLLRRHRLHALARSPLGVRIGILRKIADIDASNPIWDDDIRTYERARLGQIPQELSLCVQQRAVERIAELDQELRSPAWRERPSKALIGQTGDARRRLRAEQARGELEDVVQNLCKAFAAFDIPAGRALRDRFNALQEVAQFSPGDRLVDLAGPALDWVHKQDMRESQEQEHEAVLAQLSAAVEEESADRDELIRLRELAQQDDREVPADLDARVVKRIRAIDRATIRKSRLVIAGTAIGILLAGSLVGTAIVLHQRSIHKRQSVEKLKDRLEAGDLVEAQRVADDLAPGILAEPEVQKLVNELSSRRKDEKERQIARRAALDAAQQNGLKNATWDSFDNAIKQVQLAEERSRTQEEKSEAAELEQKIKDHRQEMEVVESRRVDDQLKDLRKQLDGARGDIVKLHSLQETAQKLEQQPHIGVDSQAQFKNLIGQIGEEVAKLEQEERRSVLLTSITKQVGDTERYLEALRTYAREFQDEPRSKAFLVVAEKEAIVLRAIKNWNNLIDDWSEVDFRSVSKLRAESLLTESQEPIREMPFHPAAKEVEKYRSVLKFVQDRVVSDSQGRINSILTHPSIQELYYLREADSRRYYCLDQPVESDERCSFAYVKSSEDKKTFKKSIDRKTVTRLNEKWQSPQFLFAQGAQKRIDDLDRVGWEQTFYEVLLDLTGNQEMDPILKLKLLKTMIPPIRAGSQFFQEQLKETENKIQNAALGIPANWCDPDDAQVNRTRDQAQTLLGRLLPNVNNLAEPLNKYRAWLQKGSFGSKYRWCGCVYRQPTDSKWVCYVNQKLRGGASKPLFTVISTSDRSLEFAKFVTVDDLRAEPLEGRAVFVEIDGTKKE